LFISGTGIGLDIGSKKIKLVKVKRRGKKIEPVLYGSLDTPPGAVDAGTILDIDALGQSIRSLVDEMKVKGSQVVSAVSGQQIYIRNLVMPYMKSNELREAAIYQSSTFLPISTDEAAMDVFPLRNFSDSEGKKTEVFFVAARKVQVASLLVGGQTAGLKPTAIELEPLALHRLYRDKEDKGVIGILNIGASRSYIAIFNGHILSSLRHLSLGCSAFLQGYSWGEESAKKQLDDINLNDDSSYSYLLGDISTEILRTLDYYSMQNEGQRADKIIVTGGGSRLQGLNEYLASALGYAVETASFANSVLLPDTLTDEERRQMVHDYPVALGLAARGVI